MSWSSIPSGHGALADIAIPNAHNHSDLAGLDVDDHSAIYPGIAQTETITGAWTIATTLKISKPSTLISIDFYDNAVTPVLRGGIRAQDTPAFIVEAISGPLHLKVPEGSNLQIWTKISGTPVSIAQFDDGYFRFSRNVRMAEGNPITDCADDLGRQSGPTLRWKNIWADIYKDFLCSEYPEPQNAFEVLALQKHFLGKDAPKGKILSKNFSGPLRPWDEKKGKPHPKGRDLSMTVTYLIYAIGDIKELLDTYEQRIINLETR